VSDKDGAALIAAERRRQIEGERWTPEHDDEHDSCEMTMAAHGYAWFAVGQVNGECWPDDPPSDWGRNPPPASWPWARSWWKPSDDPIRNLVKAGALIAAEIDRLQRVRRDH
jgi:hypothetical protein